MIITKRNKLFDCNNTLKTALHPQLKGIKTQANTEMGTFISAQISPHKQSRRHTNIPSF